MAFYLAEFVGRLLTALRAVFVGVEIVTLVILVLYLVLQVPKLVEWWKE